MSKTLLRSLMWSSALALGACAHGTHATTSSGQPTQVITPPPPPAQPEPPPQPAPPPPPPPTEDELDQKGPVGTIAADAVTTAFNGISQALDACFADAQANHKYLGGDLELKLLVGHAGHVRHVFIQQPLGDFDLEVCAAAAAEKITFPAPTGGTRAEVVHTLSFKGTTPLEKWASDKVGGPFATHRKELDACVNEHVHGVPRSMRVGFFVLGGGKVETAGIGADEELDAGYRRCIVKAVSTWKFPGKKVVRATYQF